MAKTLSRNRVSFFAVAALALLLQSMGAMATPTCPEGIGASKGDAPQKIYHLRNSPALLLCGFSGEEAGLGRYYSEYDLINARTEEHVITFDALQMTKVHKTGNKLAIYLYKNYPVNPELDYKYLRFLEYTVQWTGKNFKADCKIVFKRPHFPKTELNKIYQEYLSATKSSRSVEGIEDLIVMAAMSGSKRFRQLLPDAPKALQLDGALAESFDSDLRDLKTLDSGKCMVNVVVPE